jgi:serine/threonine-protein kinase
MIVRLFGPNYIAAAIAIVPAIVLHRLGSDLHRAEEMGSYRLVERLGEGGMGEVWRAKHRRLARPAAIKLIRPEVLGQQNGEDIERTVARFEREAQATAVLTSPHTIKVYDFGTTDDGVFFYVMEMLDGLDLETLVGRFGPLSPERTINFMIQACDSLAEAHQRGMTHRDIKPANIYVCRSGMNYDFIKILDFGLVKTRTSEEAANITREGITTGTPAYMAPEIAIGQAEVDGRSDIYALGCVAYWLLTGELVFEGSTGMQIALQHINAQPVPPSARSEIEIPQSLERVILACLEKDPEQRPQTAEELSRMLQESQLETTWSNARARHWWSTHLPEHTVAQESILPL